MKISILLPTLGSREIELKRLINSLNEQTIKNFELIVVAQDNYEKVNKILQNSNFRCIQVNSNKKGLSYARNLGMEYVSGNYLVLSDDDAWYPENSMEKIENNFRIYSDEVICYKIYDPIQEKFYKNYKKHKKIVNQRELLRKSSIEICMNLLKIKKEEIVFNESFGLGTAYTSGEENLLLNEFFKKGYSMIFLDETIVFHPSKTASTINDKFILTKSKILKEILGSWKGYIFMNLILIKNINRIESLNVFKLIQHTYRNFFNIDNL